MPCLRNCGQEADLRRIKQFCFVITPSRWIQLLNRDTLAVSIWWFSTLSQALQTQIIQRPLRRRWARIKKKTIQWILQAVFWHVQAVFSCSVFLSEKMKKGSEHIGTIQKSLTGLRNFADCRCPSELLGWCNKVQNVFLHALSCFICIDLLESHSIAITIVQIILSYYYPLIADVQWLTILKKQWIETNSSDKVGCSKNVFVSIPTITMWEQ